MAKVIAPLLSGSASGKIGNMMVFDKRGHVRKYVVPANPKSLDQMLVRNTLGDIQRSLAKIGIDLRLQLKSQFGYRWNSVIVGELTKNNKAALTTYLGTFTAFTAPQKAEWATADTSTPVELDDGFALFAAARATYDIGVRLGATLSLSAPGAANAATVGAEWVSNP